MHTFQPSPISGHELEGDAAGVPSPALLLYPDRIEENVRRMLAMAEGSVERLRPHVKTNKLAEVVRIQLDAGIGKFKCATIAEAEMLGGCGADDVLLAMQPVGPNMHRLLALMDKFPNTTFSTIVDDPSTVRQLGEAASKAGHSIPVYIDIDCGMHRSGVSPSRAGAVIDALLDTSGVELAGLHVYDGHLHDPDPADRTEHCRRDWEEVESLRQTLAADPRLDDRHIPVVAGGTPSFPIHAARKGDIDECSPGTLVFWDAGYATTFADLDFLHAAVVLTRVISKPGDGRLCLDLGHKSIAAENPIDRRVRLIGVADVEFVSQSEEHLVIETPDADSFQVGDPMYGVPWHICPTVALYDEAVIVRDGRAVDHWKIRARARRLTV